MEDVQIEKVIEFENEILSHSWDVVNDEIVLLQGGGKSKCLVKLSGADYSIQAEHSFLDNALGKGSPHNITSDKTGKHVALFFSSKVVIHTWADGHPIATIEASEIGSGTFEGGGFFNAHKIWIRLLKGNRIYLVTWDWVNGDTDWYSLRVNLNRKYYEEGGEFDCHRLAMHPSNKFFLGVTDTYDGGYLDKVFYVPSFEAHTLQYIHPEGFDQDEIRTWFNHVFNQAGTKLAGVSVHNSNDPPSFYYEVRVYKVADFTQPIQTHIVKNQTNAFFDIQFMGNDNYLMIKGGTAFSIVDLNHKAIVFQQEGVDKGVSFDANKSRFCTRKQNQLCIYKLSSRFYEEKKSDKELSTGAYSDAFSAPSRVTILHQTKCYPDLGFVPYLKVYFEFYAATFDIRTQHQLQGDVLPKASTKVVNEWFENNQADYLEKWNAQMAVREKYIVPTELGEVELYPLAEHEYDKGPMLTLVYESQVLSISFFERFTGSKLPGKVAAAVKKWLVDNYDTIIAPWKEKPYYANFKLINDRGSKEEESARKGGQASASNTITSFLRKVRHFFKL